MLGDNITGLTLDSNTISSAAISLVTICARHSLSPDNSTAESLPTVCAIDSSRTSTKVCNSPPFKDRNFYVQYSPTTTSLSLRLNCSSTPTVPRLIACTLVWNPCKIVKVFAGDVLVSGTSTLAGHKFVETSWSHRSHSVRSSLFFWVPLFILRKLLKVRGILPANLLISHGCPIPEIYGYSLRFWNAGFWKWRKSTLAKWTKLHRSSISWFVIPICILKRAEQTHPFCTICCCPQLPQNQTLQVEHWLQSRYMYSSRYRMVQRLTNIYNREPNANQISFLQFLHFTMCGRRGCKK